MKRAPLLALAFATLAAVGCSDDDDDCASCPVGWGCTGGVCVPPDAGADADADTATGDDAATGDDTATGADADADAGADDARIGPCAAEGGICRGLVSGCANCGDGEEPALSTIRCPPEEYCCMPTAVPPPSNPCVDQGGVCFPASSGSECPTGWHRDFVECNGPAGCCLPGDFC